MNYFLDTNICIYFLNGTFKKIQDYLIKQNPINIKIPSIVKAELLYGAEKSKYKKENKDKIIQFLFPFEIINFDDKAALIYSKTRAAMEKEGKIIGPNYLIIASTVIANNGVLVTNNIKEFKMIPAINLENWTQ